ncbi:hypothetical protein QUF44_14360 [Bacillus subtilis]|nr:hypothetical protein [Bacillus subtilis]MDM5302749.1 hypothetical protein [Bacillus subtilis]MDM5324802.1 hypothetical protein [Bacillus subtilis]
MNKSLADMQGIPLGFPSLPQPYYPAAPAFYQQPFGNDGYGQPSSQSYSPMSTPSAMYSSFPYASGFYGQQFAGGGYSGHGVGFSIPATHTGGFHRAPCAHVGFRY